MVKLYVILFFTGLYLLNTYANLAWALWFFIAGIVAPFFIIRDSKHHRFYAQNGSNVLEYKVFPSLFYLRYLCTQYTQTDKEVPFKMKNKKFEVRALKVCPEKHYPIPKVD